MADLHPPVVLLLLSHVRRAQPRSAAAGSSVRPPPPPTHSAAGPRGAGARDLGTRPGEAGRGAGRGGDASRWGGGVGVCAPRPRGRASGRRGPRTRALGAQWREGGARCGGGRRPTGVRGAGRRKDVASLPGGGALGWEPG